ncbi:MAG: Rpn family recombination-promoting nuclease/putative transposase [Anaerolineae bacterium]|nr:Rpn family recombination-promoting nuclease/putative transposase [Anaerolineae bacterium]
MTFCKTTYLLYDFSYLSEEEIRGEAATQIALQLIRHVFDGQLVKKLPDIFALFEELKNQTKALQSLATVLRYLAVAAEWVTPEQMREALAPVLRYEGDKQMATLAQQWLEEGRQKGLQEGRQEGLQQGLRLMQQNVLELLEDRLQSPTPELRGRIEAITDLQLLSLLVRRAATVDNIAEFVQALETLTDSS